MARPREFDREEALERATDLFWSKGYASTSTGNPLSNVETGTGGRQIFGAVAKAENDITKPIYRILVAACGRVQTWFR
jgi:hypothetical protein